MATVLLIDDHDIVRFGIETLMRDAGFEVIGSANSLEAGLAGIRDGQPDLAITDMGTGDSQGLDTVRRVVAAQAPRPVLVVSMQDELLYGEQVVALGASGYVMKETAHASIVQAARTILDGGKWLSPALMVRMAEKAARRRSGLPSSSDDQLTSRELDILELLKLGKSTKEIASSLNLSVRTVDSHRANIKHKLELRTGAELIAFASTRL